MKSSSTSDLEPAIPMTPADALARCGEQTLPPALLEVLTALQAAGHEALLVGGAVRDCLLGREGGDWDVATSATPAQVQQTFRRTIPTGIDHGTVTVLLGTGDAAVSVEVTTFRGEGQYVDGRHPTTVHFLSDVRGDLARRDFTVNAFAWDPVRARFFDEFDGLSDLAARRIRAVGDPLERFAEDGLRTIRGVRFAATLGFEMEATTRAAIAPRLHVFDKVARERVRVELFKLLEAPDPRAALMLMHDTGLWGRVWPEAELARCEAVAARIAGVSRDAVVRCATILHGVGASSSAAARSLDGLKLSRAHRRTIEALLSDGVGLLPHARDDRSRRAAAVQVGAAYLEAAYEVVALDAAAVEAMRAAVRGCPLSVGDLAIKGGELIEQGWVRPGPMVRGMLEALLDWTLDDPRRNDPSALRARACELAPAFTGS